MVLEPPCSKEKRQYKIFYQQNGRPAGQPKSPSFPGPNKTGSQMGPGRGTFYRIFLGLMIRLHSFQMNHGNSGILI